MPNAPTHWGGAANVCQGGGSPRTGTLAARGLRTWELGGVQEASFQKTEGCQITVESSGNPGS